MKILNELIEELKDKCVLELEPKLDGYNIIAVLTPV